MSLMVSRKINAPLRRSPVLAAVLASGLLSACATSEVAEDGVHDPFEPVNRVIFDGNLIADDYVVRPVAEAYGTVVPEPVRDSIQNVLRNMRQPIIFANEVLQGDWEGAEVAVSRFLINSTIGLAGLNDVAGMDKRLAYRSEDFGQTLAVWGVDEGPYLVLPFLGPSNVRDAAGFGVDAFADPIRWATGPIGDVDAFGPARTGVTIIDQRERTIEPLDRLRADSIDYYAALRSAYQQFREGEIVDGRVETEVDIPNYEFPDAEASEQPETTVPEPGGADQVSEIWQDRSTQTEGPDFQAGPVDAGMSADEPVETVIVERRRTLLGGFLRDVGVLR